MTIFYGKRRLTPDQVRDVVRRAELLDRQDLETITEDEVRTIASELGISEMALQRALATMPVVAEPTPVWKQPATVAVMTWFGGAVSAIGLSKLAGPLPQPYLAYTALSTLIALTCVSASLGFKARSDIAQRRFQLGNLAVWAGFGFTAATMGHYELAIPGFVIGSVAALIGWVANRLIGPAHSASTPGESSGGSASASEADWRSKLAKLFRRDGVMFLEPLPGWLTRRLRIVSGRSGA